MCQDAKLPLFHQYHSGRRIDLENIGPDDINIGDIAHSLAMIPRFAGNTSRPYTVAEHSLMVMQMVEAMGHGPLICLQALLHDATEAFLGDIPSPVKVLVPEIRDFETQVLWPAVAEHFNLPIDMHESVKKADWIAFYVEASSLCFADNLNEWERYDEWMPHAEEWMKANGSLAPQEMPHPGLVMKIFMDSYNALVEEIKANEKKGEELWDEARGEEGSVDS